MRWQFFEKAVGSRQKAESKLPSADCVLPSEIRCPLCGKQFSAEDAAQCAMCALARRCGLVMCPNCLYEFAP
jgi:transcription elongation factor Elf1